MESQSGSSSSSSSMDISTGIDRLSGLPDSVICHILSFLPTKKAVATSTLSTRWRSLWADVTSLDANFDEITSFNTGNPDDSSNRSAKGAEFAQIVNKILLLRNAESLHKFRLDWNTASKQEADYVSIWVSYAIARKLRYLNLGFDPESLGGNIPATLFTCETLEFLHLCGSFTIQVPSVVCLPKLEEIILTFPRYGSNESIPSIISGCPVLHSLTICCETYDIDIKIPSPSLRHLVLHNSLGLEEHSVYDKKLEIDAPNLESLSLDDPWYDCSIKWPSTLLNKVYLKLGDNCCAESYSDFVNGTYSDRCNSTVRLVGSLNRAKCLTLKGSVMRAISNATITLSSRFERLTQLKIDISNCQWSSLNVLLGCCTRLQFFSMTKLGYCNHNHNHYQCWKDPAQVPECLLSSLAHVSFHLFEGHEDEMSMVRYILKHGSVLESLNVRTAYSSNKLQMLQAISKFTRLSSACSVEFA